MYKGAKKLFFKWLIKKFYTIFIMPFIHRNSSIKSYIPLGIKVGKNAVILKNVELPKNLSIGSHTFINSNVQIDFNTKSIGSFCSISHGVKIGLGPHPSNYLTTSPVLYSKSRGFVSIDRFDEIKEKGCTIIENDVLIGANALILAGVKISTGAIIGSGSVVTKDVPPYAIVAGNPAKIIKYRFNDKEIQELLRSEWWKRDIEELIKYVDLIDKPMEFVKKLESNQV